MKVIHLTLTPLAGAPIRIVDALNRYTSVTARLINYNPRAYKTRTFPEDLDYSNSRDLSKELIEDADLIHLHHFINPSKNVFGINFSRKKILRHFHSEPQFVSRVAQVSVEAILNDPLPSVVIAQYPERYYPFARPLPNLLGPCPSASEVAENPFKHLSMPVVSFSPTTLASGLAERWNTKGSPETVDLLTKLQKSTKFHLDMFTDIPYNIALERKGKADIILDDMVTGSYHLSGLEGLSLGKPTFSYLDQRIISLLCSLTGSNSLPWINVHLSRLPEVLELFIDSEELREIAGRASKLWVHSYWNEQKLVKFYLTAYEDVLNGAVRLREAPVNDLYDIALPDYHWRKNIKDLNGVLG